MKIADPEFSCIAENLLETWQKANQTFKKIEYTMQVQMKNITREQFRELYEIWPFLVHSYLKCIPWYCMKDTSHDLSFNFQLKIDGKTYLASSNQKKAAKQALKLINKLRSCH